MISKRGTNEFHGSLVRERAERYFQRAERLCHDTSDRPLQSVRRILWRTYHSKDRLFFFRSPMRVIGRATRSLVSGLVPTPELKQQAIAAVPVYKAAIGSLAESDGALRAGCSPALYRGVAANQAHDNHTVLGVDYQLDNANALSGRWTRGEPFQVNPRLLAVQSDTYHGKAQQVLSLTWTHVGSVVDQRNPLRLQQQRHVARPEAVRVGNCRSPTPGSIQYGWRTLTLYGHSYTIEQVIAKTLGRQTIKFGGLFGAQTPGRFDEQVPNFRYATVADLLANNPNQVTFTFGVPRYYGRTWSTGCLSAG